MSFPGHVVDRTAFLEGATGINPAYNVARVIGKLEEAGAKTIGIACNTTHSPAIFDVIGQELERNKSRANLLNMPYETCRLIGQNHPHVRRVGLLATNGTYRFGVYEKILRGEGYSPVFPDYGFQNGVIHKMVYDPVFGLKANAARVTPQVLALMERALLYFRELGADAIILGCTEFSLIMDRVSNDQLLITRFTRYFFPTRSTTIPFNSTVIPPL
jgi:aspartate racemase